VDEAETYRLASNIMRSFLSRSSCSLLSLLSAHSFFAPTTGFSASAVAGDSAGSFSLPFLEGSLEDRLKRSISVWLGFCWFVNLVLDCVVVEASTGVGWSGSRDAGIENDAGGYSSVVYGVTGMEAKVHLQQGGNLSRGSLPRSLDWIACEIGNR
jgi:hypothetical protein